MRAQHHYWAAKEPCPYTLFIIYLDQMHQPCHKNDLMKLFLIIIKIFYWNEIFVAIVYCQRLYRNSGQRIFFVAIEVYCNNLNFITTKPPNVILRDFDDYLIDDAGHVAANNDNNVVYNDQPYCYGNLSQRKFYCNKL